MPEGKEKLEKEAADPKTDHKRLRAITKKLPAVASVVAANPGCDEELLLSLASDHPAEVVNNPVFQLLVTEGKEWWKNCSGPSLINLLAFMRRQGPDAARQYLFTILQEALSNIKKNYQGEVTWSFEIEIAVVSALTATMSSSDQTCTSDSSSTFEMVTAKTVAVQFECSFSAAFELFEGEQPETPCQLVDILEGIVTCQSAAEEYMGWHIEHQGSEGGRWNFDILDESEWEIEEGDSSDGLWGIHISDQVGNQVFVPVEPMDYEWNEVWSIPNMAKHLMGPAFNSEEDVSNAIQLLRSAFCLH